MSGRDDRSTDQPDSIFLSDVSLLPEIGGVSILWITPLALFCVIMLFPVIVKLWWFPIAVIIDVAVVGSVLGLLIATLPHLSPFEYILSTFVEAAPERERTAEIAYDPIDYEQQLDEIDGTHEYDMRDVIENEIDLSEQNHTRRILGRGALTGFGVGIVLSALASPVPYFLADGIGAAATFATGLTAISTIMGAVVSAEKLAEPSESPADEVIRNE